MPTELSELFDRDPLLLSDQDTDVIVARIREAQAQHELGVKPVSVARPKKKSSKTLDLLSDLGLGEDVTKQIADSANEILKDLGLK